MPIKIQSNAEFRAQLLSLQGLIEYSTDKLVFLSPALLTDLTFSWISPTNRKFQERLMYRDTDEDQEGFYAYSAIIYPVFTAGVQGDVGKTIVSFRSGEIFSSIVRMPVNKSLLPEQTTMPISLYDEIGADLLLLHNKDMSLDAIDASLQAQIDLKSGVDHIHTETDITDLDKYTQAETDGKLALKADLVNGEIPASQLPSYVDDVLEFADFGSFPIDGETGKVYVDIAEGDTYRWSGSAYIKISDLLSAADIKAMYETNSNTNAFTDALANKLNSIEAGAQVNTIIGVNGKVGNVVLNTDDVNEGVVNEYFTEQRVTDSAAILQVNSDLESHALQSDNPHMVNKVQIGLDEVDNTSDINKPISTLQQAALDLKADLVGGKVPLSQLPSFDGSFFESATFADLPATGESGTMYIVIADETDLGTTSSYRWSGTQYVIINDAISGTEIKALYEGIANTNAFTDAYKAEVDANTLKTGITAQQAADILVNNAKVTYDAQAEVAANTAKVGITPEQAQQIIDNAEAGGLTTEQAAELAAELGVDINALKAQQERVEAAKAESAKTHAAEAIAEEKSELPKPAPRPGNNPFSTGGVVPRPPRPGNNPFSTGGTTPRPPQRPSGAPQRPGGAPQRPGMSGPRPGSVRPGFAARPPGARPPAGAGFPPRTGAPSTGAPASPYIILRLDSNQLVLKKESEPIFPGEKQERYVIRYFTRIPLDSLK